MATDPADLLSPREDAGPAAPLAGTRSQSMQRLQIGLFGLAAMVLLVSLANIIVTNSQENEARVVRESAPTETAGEQPAPSSDPLADAGVVPAAPHNEEEAQGGSDEEAPAFQP